MSKIKILVFDTKRAGIPKHYDDPIKDLNNYPPIVRFSSILLELDLKDLTKMKVIHSCDTLIKPERKGNTIRIHPKEVELHGISAEVAKNGDSICNIALLFQGLWNSVDLIISHNYTIQKNVMVSELLNLGIDPKYNKSAKIICPMKYGMLYTKIPGKKEGTFKFPNLQEVFEHTLERDDFEELYNINNSMECVQATVHWFIDFIKVDKNMMDFVSGKKDKLF